MAFKHWTLLDLSTNSYLESLDRDALKRAGPAVKGCRVDKRTLRGGLSDGVEVIRVDNGRLVVEVLPSRGMGLWKAWCDSLEIGWRSPVRGPVHPAFVPLAEPSGLGWLDGFDELLVRCGLESNGAPEFGDDGRLRYPLHGRIGNKPAHRVSLMVDGDAGELALTGEVEESRFHFAKLRLTSTLATRAGESGFRIRDVVKNLSNGPAQMQLLYHVNFGAPLLEADARFVAPVRQVVPRTDHAAAAVAGWDRYGPPEVGFQEQVYFLELLGDARGDTHTLLHNADASLGVSLGFNLGQLPWYTLWKNTAALGDGYVTGLEPGTNFPNPRSHEGAQGRVVELPPGGEAVFELGLEFHDSPEAVAAARRTIGELQGDSAPTVFDRPQPGWVAMSL